MPRKDRTFTHSDVIRIFENNLGEGERIKVLVYMFLYLLGFEKVTVVLKIVYRDAKQLTLPDVGAALIEIIGFFILKYYKWRSVDFTFDWLFNLYSSTDQAKLQEKIKKKNEQMSSMIA